MNVDTAYAVCARITRGEARNFSYGIALLPGVKRRALTAVYAMARRVDDIGDGDQPDAVKKRLLDQARDDLHNVHAHPEDPVLVALADAADRLPIPLPAFDELVDGCAADVSGRSYDTFDELVGYCRCVAGSIGRLSLGVYAPPEADGAAPLADALGVALQITNILRDLREDRLTGRIYLPQEDLDRFGCTLRVDDRGNLTDDRERFASLVRFQADRAERWYAEGLTLLPLLDRRSAACTAAMAGIYRRLLHRIAADPDQVRDRRLSLPVRERARVASTALIRGAV